MAAYFFHARVAEARAETHKMSHTIEDNILPMYEISFVQVGPGRPGTRPCAGKSCLNRILSLAESLFSRRLDGMGWALGGT
jgi:hypothetical protein